MAKLTINVGATANDRQGDSLRGAFQKINANFSELYTALGLNSDTTLNLGAFQFTGSVMDTTDSSAITIDQAVTVSSNLTVGGDILPSTANGGDLGSSTNPWRSLYVSNNTIFLGGTNISVDSNGQVTTPNGFAANQLIVNDLIDLGLGATLSSDEVVGSNNTVTLTAPVDGSAVLSSNESTRETQSSLGIQAELAFIAVHDAEGNLKDWTFNENGNLKLPAGGDIVDSTGESVLGGPTAVSELTNDAGYITLAEVTGGITVNPTGDLKGSVFGDDSTILVDGTNSKINLNGTILDGLVGIATENLRVESGKISLNSNQTSLNLYTDAGGTYTSSSWSGNNIDFIAVEDIYLETLLTRFFNHFDGSGLPWNVGYSNITVRINDSQTLTVTGAEELGGGDWRVTVAETPVSDPTAVTTAEFFYDFVSTLELDRDNNSYAIALDDSNFRVNTRRDIRLESGDDIYIDGRSNMRLRNYSRTSGITIETDFNNSAYEWLFDEVGTLTTPGDIIVAGDITGTSGASTLVLKAEPNSNTYIQLNDTVDSTINTVANLEISTDVANTAKTWTFGTDGSLTFPDSTTQTTAYTGPQDLSGYQTTLVSGTSIKTINGTSLLGSGNISVALSTGSIEFAGSVISTSDSSAISLDQAVTVTSNLTVDGDLSVNNSSNIIVGNTVIRGDGSITSGSVDLSSGDWIKIPQVETSSVPQQSGTVSYNSSETLDWVLAEYSATTSLLTITTTNPSGALASSLSQLGLGDSLTMTYLDPTDMQNYTATLTLSDEYGFPPVTISGGGGIFELSGNRSGGTEYLVAVEKVTIDAITVPNFVNVDVPPTSAGQEGMLRYNKDNNEVQLYTTSWGSLVGVDLTAFSVGAEASASGDGGIAYDNSTGVFTYTPPVIPTAYTDSDVNAHLNTGTASSGEVLSWTGSDYDWVAQSSGGADLSAVNQNYTPDTDNAYDLGIAAGNFLRTGYFKTSVVIGDDQSSNATLTYNADGELQSSATINANIKTFSLTSSSYMSINAGFGGLIFWQEVGGGGPGGHSGMNGNGEMVWYGGNYSDNGPTYQLDKDQANLQIGGEVTRTITGITLGATTRLSLSGPYYPNSNTTVTITGVVGTTELNNQTYFISSLNQLFTDAALTTPLDSSLFTAYVSGGTAVFAPRATASLPVLHSAPATPKSGMMAVADGTNWNPTGTGTETMVVYLGGAWRTIANA